MAEFNLQQVEIWPQFGTPTGSYPGDPLSSSFRNTFNVEESILPPEDLDVADFADVSPAQMQQDINQFKAALFEAITPEAIELISLAGSVQDMLSETPRAAMIAQGVPEANSAADWADKVASMRNPVTDGSFMGDLANMGLVGEITNNIASEAQSRNAKPAIADIAGNPELQRAVNEHPAAFEGQTSPVDGLGPGSRGVSSGDIV